MGMAGEAHWAMGVMWTFVGLVSLFLTLRVYTRIACVASFGIDDYIYVVAYIFLLIFTIFTQLSAEIGFGQDLEQIGDMEKVTQATLYECIGQGFAIVGMAIAKASLGFFLLRLVSVNWQRTAIWAAMVLVTLASIAQVLCFWLSCVPLKFVYDKRIRGGYCPIDTRPTSYILCISTVLVDFFFAVFPWVIVWNLQMPNREKYTIAGSMSLGLIAAAAGIKRTTTVEGLYTLNYLQDSVSLIVWSSAEMAITLVCIGIPVCLPLYKSIYRRLRPGQPSSGFSDEQNGGTVPLQTIGGGYVGKDGQPVSKSKSSSASKGNRSFTDTKLGVRGTTTQTFIGRVRSNSSTANTSDEEILGDEYRRGARKDESQECQEGRHHGIMVTKSYRVDS